jgi:hypothetical protein
MVPFALIEITPAKLIARDEIYLYYIDAMSSDLTIMQYLYLYIYPISGEPTLPYSHSRILTRIPVDGEILKSIKYNSGILFVNIFSVL